MILCFWCSFSKPPGPNAHLLPDESENAFYTPCTDCEGAMAKGVTIVEVLAAASDQKGLRLAPERTVYPSGLWAVVPVGWIEDRLGEEARDLMKGPGFTFVDPGTWDLLGLARTVQVVEV